MALNLAVPTRESLLGFSEVYLQAIELSWRSSEFKEEFIKNPMSALQHYFHYTPSWNCILNVTEPKNESNDKPFGWDNKTKTWNLPTNTLSVGLPKAPKIDQQAVALALYNNAGPSYLFTCC